MHEKETKGVRSLGPLLLGFFFYLFILTYDSVALFLNAVKRFLSIPTLTDFRKFDESRLVIPDPLSTLKPGLSVKKSINLLNNQLTFALPHLPAHTNDILIEVYLEVEPAESVELELQLSGTGANNQSETIFLFATPFLENPKHHYTASKLWFNYPTDQQLVLDYVDAQPKAGASFFSFTNLRVVDWR